MTSQVQLDLTKLAAETIQALAGDDAIPADLKSAARAELADREKKSSSPPNVRQVAGDSVLVGSFAGRSDRLVKSMEKKAAAMKGRQ